MITGSRITGISAVLAMCFISFGLSSCSKADTGAVAKSSDMDEFAPLFNLSIRPIRGLPSGQLGMQAQVENISGKTVGWDREFAVFVRWRVHADEDEHLLSSDLVAEIPRTKETTGRDRFLELKAGEKYRKDIVLTQGFRRMTELPLFVPGESHIVGIRWKERTDRYQIREHVNKLTIWMEYYSLERQSGAFRDMFGFEKDTVDIWHGNCRSNEVVVPIKSVR
jgi:hypothetical protein